MSVSQPETYIVAITTPDTQPMWSVVSTLGSQAGAIEHARERSKLCAPGTAIVKVYKESTGAEVYRRGYITPASES